jgi:hypothetical protein
MKNTLTIALAALLALLSSVSYAQTTSKIDGVVFADYSYNVKNSVPAEKDRNAFQFRRVYFTFENNINTDIKVRFRLESESNAYGSTSKINPFVKHAYIEWSNLVPNHKLYLGIAETNAFKNSEEYWGYRSIEKTIMDLNKISSSADMGLALKGDLNSNVHHWLTVMNGTGYGASEGDRFKKIGYALWLTPAKGLIVEGYADYEKQDPAEPQTATAMSAGKDYAGSTGYMTWKAFVGYDRPRYTVGAEYFQRTNQNSGIKNAVITNAKLASFDKADVTKRGYSVFGSLITPLPKLKVYARYDSFDPNQSETAYTKFSSSQLSGNGVDDENSLFIAGLDFIPTANVHIMPNAIIKQYSAQGSKNDITARITLYCKFDSGSIITQ